MFRVWFFVVVLLSCQFLCWCKDGANDLFQMEAKPEKIALSTSIHHRRRPDLDYYQFPPCDNPCNDDLHQLTGPSNVTFTLFTRRFVDPLELTATEEEPLSPAFFQRFSFDKNLTLVWHGFQESIKNRWIQLLTDLLLNKHDINVVAVNWNDNAFALKFPKYSLDAEDLRCFLNRKMNSIKVNRIVPRIVSPSADFVKSVIKRGYDPERIHFVGFNLGGQIASFSAERVFSECGKRIGKLTSLDPLSVDSVKYDNVAVSSEIVDTTDPKRDWHLGLFFVADICDDILKRKCQLPECVRLSTMPDYLAAVASCQGNYSDDCISKTVGDLRDVTPGIFWTFVAGPQDCGSGFITHMNIHLVFFIYGITLGLLCIVATLLTMRIRARLNVIMNLSNKEMSGKEVV